MCHSGCFGAGRFTQIQSSWTVSPRSRKWMSGPAGSAQSTAQAALTQLVTSRKRQIVALFVSSKPALRKTRPSSAGRSVFSLDKSLSWMSPRFPRVAGISPLPQPSADPGYWAILDGGGYRRALICGVPDQLSLLRVAALGLTRLLASEICTPSDAACITTAATSAVRPAAVTYFTNPASKTRARPSRDDVQPDKHDHQNAQKEQLCSYRHTLSPSLRGLPFKRIAFHASESLSTLPPRPGPRACQPRTLPPGPCCPRGSRSACPEPARRPAVPPG